MGILYHNKYRIPTTRLHNWDYSQNGYYFVTICTYKKQEYFGEIVNWNMKLSVIGKIAENELLKTEEIRQNVFINQYIIMPNHIHMIFVIRNTKHNGTGIVETHCNASLPNVFGPQSNNLASIVRGYKSAVKRYANKQNIPFHWQPRYYDHIIRNEESYLKIIQYIKDNPRNWETDRNNISVETPNLGVST